MEGEKERWRKREFYEKEEKFENKRESNWIRLKETKKK